MMSNPAMRKKMREMKERREGRDGETKEARKERKRREKEVSFGQDRGGAAWMLRTKPPFQDRKSAKRESRHPHRERKDARDDWDARNYAHDDHIRSRRHEDRERTRSRSRSRSPERTSRRYDDRDRRDGWRRDVGDRRRSPDYTTERRNLTPPRDVRPVNNVRQRPTATEMMDRPSTSVSADDTRAARLAQMALDAAALSTDRLTLLSRRQREEEEQLAAENKARLRLGKGDTKGDYVREQERLALGGGAGGMGLAETLGRRGGRGLQKE